MLKVSTNYSTVIVAVSLKKDAISNSARQTKRQLAADRPLSSTITINDT